jgi:hypothetical protein
MISSGVLSPYMLVMSGCLWFNKKKKQKKFWGNWYVVPFKTVPTRDIRNSVHEKVTEFREIPRNFTEFYTSRNSAEFRWNFSQFRTEYGIDGSKKKTDGIPCRRNSVDTLETVLCEFFPWSTNCRK